MAKIDVQIAPRNPALSHAELMQITPAATLAEIYETGRGSMKVRARWKIEELARGQWQAVVTELPPGVSSQKVLEEVEELTNPKIKLGKKALSGPMAEMRTSRRKQRSADENRCWRIIWRSSAVVV